VLDAIRRQVVTVPFAFTRGRTGHRYVSMQISSYTQIYGVANERGGLVALGGLRLGPNGTTCPSKAIIITGYIHTHIPWDYSGVPQKYRSTLQMKVFVVTNGRVGSCPRIPCSMRVS
jgi:hypothetical protein